MRKSKKRPKSKRLKPLWSNEDRTALDSLLPLLDLSIPEIAAQLGRTENSVKSYMRRHNLRRAGPVKSRHCLNCQRTFIARYRFNYLCPKCKLDPSWTTLADQDPI